MASLVNTLSLGSAVISISFAFSLEAQAGGTQPQRVENRWFLVRTVTGKTETQFKEQENFPRPCPGDLAANKFTSNRRGERCFTKGYNGDFQVYQVEKLSAPRL